MNLSNPKAVAADIEAVLKKHKVDNLYYPHMLGAALDILKEQCAGNSVRWVLDGLFSSYVARTKAMDTVKQLVDLLDVHARRLNYNDLDCNLWGKKIVIPKECLECSSLVAQLEIKGKKAPKPEDCPRCHGTKIDPEFQDFAWVLYYDNHGNSHVFVVQENCLSNTLHIRRLPYNLSRTAMKKHFKLFCDAAAKDRYDSDYEYMRYHDRRDTGFMLSLSIDKKDNDLRVSDCETVADAIADLDTVTQHFPYVIEEFANLAAEDTLPA